MQTVYTEIQERINAAHSMEKLTELKNEVIRMSDDHVLENVSSSEKIGCDRCRTGDIVPELNKDYTYNCLKCGNQIEVPIKVKYYNKYATTSLRKVVALRKRHLFKVIENRLTIIFDNYSTLRL